MFNILFFTLIIGFTSAEYAGSSSSENSVASDGVVDNESAGSDTAYGYAGSFSGAGGIPPNFAFAPFPQFDFQSALKQYFDSLQKYHQQFLANLQQNIAASAAAGAAGGSYAPPVNNWGYGSNVGGSYGQGGGAVATAGISPGGGFQSAGVFPENPNVPNFQTRFAGSGGNAPGGFKFYGVSTSSQSGSSNVDGKPTSFHRATTTVNDNGKVSTYSVHNP